MPRSALTGTRIRERRTFLGLKQAELAREVEISPSYLNLIEHNRRRIAGKLLSEIARVLEVDISVLTQGAQVELLESLTQAVADAPKVEVEADRIDEFVGRFPGWAELVQVQHRRIRELHDRIEGLSDRLSHDPRLSSAMHDVLSKVTAIRSAASILYETDDIDEAWRRRFHRNLNTDSLALTESAQDLVTYLDSAESENVTAAGPWEEVEQYLESREFHLPECEPGGDGQLVDLPDEISPMAQDLLATYTARYMREALLVPLDDVETLLATKADPVAWAAEHGVPVATVFRRIASVPPQTAGEGPGMVLCDATGAILLRKPCDGFLSPRSGHGCPLWPVYEALGAPGRPISRVLAHSAAVGTRVRTYAVAEPRWPMGAGAPALVETWMIVLPMTGTPVTDPGLPVGSACRVCSLPLCAARQVPSLLAGRDI